MKPTAHFVGRDEELDELVELLGDVPLVTLVGPGGVGKTTLARHAAASAAPFLFVDASEAVDGEGLAEAILRSGGIKARVGAADEQARRSLLQYDLVVLDNLEQVRDAAASFVAALLSVASAPTVLATSREMLHVPGERLVRLEPLSAAEAVELFGLVARDRAAGHVEDLAEGDVRALVDALDRLPLAVSLAAARAGLLTPAQMLDRIDAVARTRTGHARHRSLESVVEWSWDLLTESTRQVLEQLCALPTGFRLDLAEQVVEVDGVLLDHIEELVDKSLLAADAEDDVVRFRVYECVRRFVGSKPGPALARRMGRYLLEHPGASVDVELLTLAVEHSEDPDLGLALLKREADRICAYGLGARAVTLAMGLRSQVDVQEWAVPTARFLYASYRISEAEDVLALVDEQHRLEPAYRRLAASIALLKNDLDAFERLLRAAETLGVKQWEIDTERALLLMHSDPEAAAELIENSPITKDGAPWLRVCSFRNRAFVYSATDWERSERENRRAAEEAEKSRIPSIEARSRNTVSALRLRRGDVAGAIDEMERALAVARRNGMDVDVECPFWPFVWFAAGRTSLDAVVSSVERDSGSSMRDAVLRTVAGVTALEAGEPQIARQLLSSALQLFHAKDANEELRPIVAAFHGISCALAGERTGDPLWDAYAGGDRSDELRRRIRTTPRPPLILHLRFALGSVPDPWDWMAENGWDSSQSESVAFHPELEWVRVPGSPRIDLSGHHLLRRLLSPMIERAKGSDDEQIGVAELLEVGWPGETMTFESGRDRVYAAIRKLRKLGLQDILLTGEEGYYLDPDLEYVESAGS